MAGRPVCSYKRDEQMKDYTSFRIGGPVRVMFFPKCSAELTELCGLLRGYDITPFMLGKGTNLLALDKQLEMVVINTLGLNNIESSGDSGILAGAGASLKAVALFAYERGLAGLEFAFGIPGTIGGAVFMNAGAYESQMKDVVELTYAMNAETGVYVAEGAEQGFGYRRSRFMDTGDVVTAATLMLEKGDKDSIKAKMDDFAIRRRFSQPLDMPSAGSVFKRPKEGYAGAFIEQAGLKGFAIGGAQVSEKHAGFIINRGDATFSDVMSLIDHVRNEVFKQFSVELELEIKIVS